MGISLGGPPKRPLEITKPTIIYAFILTTLSRTFPWIVDIFELSPYHFYKVIEIIIRAEKGLSRDVVKHLNHVCGHYLNERQLYKTIFKK